MSSEAKRRIRELMELYCRAWDRADIELALSIWHPDGTAQYLTEPVRDVRTMIPERLSARRATQVVTSHQVTNAVIAVEGDRAVSEAYGTAWQQQPGENGAIMQIHFFSRYLDSWSCRDGRWGLDHRRVLLDGHSVSSFEPLPALQAATGLGRMGPDDPSYAHLASLKAVG
ncbi:nuclear transport factor 2 family protein [Rhizorhabdus dicambivorans]|uniref:Nuclear transport factor 2 family protein n=1 Tax=Rhizorhabdus dicambivorans TaxID=1850238 RepID=A0A2A4FYC4_9SPHN|nr:nuclear transport factor 2 family protein [Rhizorhabdus dicambivorans]ATE63582.1 nuclear transport factor 2 family protein [Rhizorhabdus dicambivorans]PCE42707.1 nuclear transport factor 2 family protein [Rhizorhabdus dicambivorans]